MYRLLWPVLLSKNPGGGRCDLQRLSSQWFCSRGSGRTAPQVLSLCLWQAEGHREDERNVSQKSGEEFQFRTKLDKGPRFILECHTVPPIVKYKLLFLVRYVCNANQSVGNSSKNSSAIDLHPNFLSDWSWTEHGQRWMERSITYMLLVYDFWFAVG